MVKLRVVSAVLAAAVCIFVLFCPFPQEVAVRGESYFCRWEDGTYGKEEYATAYSSLVAASEEGIFLVRDGRRGTVAPSAEYSAVVRTLQSGSLAELTSLSAQGLSRLERAAVYRVYGERVWYDHGCFAWTGEKIAAVPVSDYRECVLLSGRLPADVLRVTRAESVFVCTADELYAGLFVGSCVERLYAASPYSVKDGALFLDTPGGRRLVAAIPPICDLRIEDADFYDGGALLPCGQIQSLTLPFVGNAKGNRGEEYRGEFAWLFLSGKDYRVPKSLKRVKVTGGAIGSHAFYACDGVEMIDACGVSSGLIEQDAFADCTGLRLLHCPRNDVTLPGTFTRRLADCGCTVFERTVD